MTQEEAVDEGVADDGEDSGKAPKREEEEVASRPRSSA